MSFRAVFLIAAAGAILHVPVSETCLLIVGYLVLGLLDDWMTKRAKTRVMNEVVDYEIHGWETDPEDNEGEIKGNLGRFKLPQKEQIVVPELRSY
jgi:hypothetical protein